MSFADEMKKPYSPDNSEMIRAVNNDIAGCVCAIKKACQKAHQNGERNISGYYGASSYECLNDCYITPKIEGGLFKRIDSGFPFDYWKAGVEKEIQKLGFTKYNVQIVTKPETEMFLSSFLGTYRTRKTGKTLAGLKIEIYW